LLAEDLKSQLVRIFIEKMEYKRLFSILVILSSLLFPVIQAQETNSASLGGNAIGAGGIASYTMGQLFVNTMIGKYSSVFQGVQQPFEVSKVTGIDQDKISLIYTVYPNPTNYSFTLLIKSDQLSDFSYQLLDITGKMLETKSVSNAETTIFMNTYARGSYILKIMELKKISSIDVKIFKIEKN